MRNLKQILALLLTLALLFAAFPEPLALAQSPDGTTASSAADPRGSLLYQGHGSLRITTLEGKVIYVDPYAGTGYNAPADLILMTHAHSDHTATQLIQTRNPGCLVISHTDALVSGDYKKFDLGYVTVEAVQAGNNPNHNINVCVGYILTFSDGVGVYISGDTSTTAQMATFAARRLDYAFFCCDGRYNMGAVEATACADLVNARYSIPYHTDPSVLFSPAIAAQFTAKNRLILNAGDVLVLEPAYKITYDLNGGNGIVPTNPDIGAGMTFVSASWRGFTGPDGKLFEEWNTMADGTGAAYPAGSIITMPAGDFKLYAVWSTERGKIDGCTRVGNVITTVSIRIIDPANAVVILVAYDPSGRLATVKECRPDTGGGTVQDVNANFSYGGAVLVRAYLWDNKMAPYTKPQEL